MTEQHQGSAAEVVQPVPQQPLESTSIATPSEPTQSVQEKMLSQLEVGKIAGASRKEGHDKGYEKGYQDALAKAQQPASQPSSANSDRQAPDLAALVSRQVAETLRQEREEQGRLAEERRAQEYVQRLDSELRPKIEAAKQKYDDFDQSVAGLYLEKAPNALQLMEWINSVPNAGDVLYDLAKNPQKVGILNSLHAPELALQQIHALSASLQNNQAAQEKRVAKDPLSVVQPSNVGKSTGASTGQQITEDARKKYRF